MNLLIDVGNSRMKWTLVADGEEEPVVHGQDVATLDTTVLSKAWDDTGKPERVVVSNVGSDSAADTIESWCRQQWNLVPDYARVMPSFDGLVCGYKDISRLGVDRWLAMIAAWTHYRGACFVVDCGTAVTMDAIDNRGQHLGGYILPGAEMMRSMLAEHTQRIGRDAAGAETGEFATDTAEAVAGGARLAVISAINAACRQLELQLGFRPQCLITGGSSSNIVNHLDGKYVYEEALVLKGLQVMASRQ